MINSLVLGSCSYPILVEAMDVHSKATSRPGSAVHVSATRKVPKLEPFNRSKLDRIAKEPPLIEKSEKEIADYCSTMEGDESYSCWRAYFELKELEKEAPKKEVEKLILEADGVKSLVGCLHGITTMFQNKKTVRFSFSEPSHTETVTKRAEFHVPDGLPKSEEDIEADKTELMPDSPFTRLLRSKGKSPAWYSQTPYNFTS